MDLLYGEWANEVGKREMRLFIGIRMCLCVFCIRVFNHLNQMSGFALGTLFDEQRLVCSVGDY